MARLDTLELLLPQSPNPDQKAKLNISSVVCAASLVSAFLRAMKATCIYHAILKVFGLVQSGHASSDREQSAQGRARGALKVHEAHSAWRTARWETSLDQTLKSSVEGATSESCPVILTACSSFSPPHPSHSPSSPAYATDPPQTRDHS